MKVRGTQLAGLLIAATAAAAVLLRFPPAASAWYPGCAFHAATGLLCPGCGGTRALAALLHGHWAEAWRDNALLLALLPLAAAYLGFAVWPWLRCREAHWPRLPARPVGLLAAVALAFAVWRNLA